MHNRTYNTAHAIAKNQQWLEFENNQVKNGIKPARTYTSSSSDPQYKYGSYFSYKAPGWKRALCFCVLQKGTSTPLTFLIESDGQNLIFNSRTAAIDSFKAKLRIIKNDSTT